MPSKNVIPAIRQDILDFSARILITWGICWQPKKATVPNPVSDGGNGLQSHEKVPDTFFCPLAMLVAQSWSIMVLFGR